MPIAKVASSWRVTINGVDETPLVDAFGFTTQLNDRSRGSIVISDRLPAQHHEIIGYAKDGMTPIFGGVIIMRTLTGRSQADPDYQVSLDCGDYFAFTDWTFSSAAYPDAVTLRTVLEDLVADHLSQYGVTLDPLQEDGPLLDPFTWQIKRVSDGLRELSDRTGYVARISAAKELRMLIPGTEAAPFAITEAATHVHDLSWHDSDRTVANTVIVVAGPTGVQQVEDERHYGDGVTRIWELNAPFVQIVGALSRSDMEGGWPVGIYGVDIDPSTGTEYPYSYDPAINSIRQRADQPIVPAGHYIWLWYMAQFPFQVTATCLPPDSTDPVIEVVEARPDVLSKPVAQSIADGLIAQVCMRAREVSFLTDEDGLAVGQQITIDLPVTRQLSGSFVITAVNMRIELDTADGDAFWQYQVEALESTVYQGSYLDQWRRMIGKGAGGGSTIIEGGSGGTLPPGGGGDGGADEVFVGPNDPGAPLELWYDTDEAAPSTTIPDHSIGLSKLVPIASQTILGRSTAGVGDVEVLTTLPTAVQNTITRVGTITAGTWHGAPIDLAYVAGAGPAGTFIRSTGAAWATSTLVVPNAIAAGRIVYATAANTYGDSPNLTFSGTALALVGDLTLTGFIGSPTYASQTTGWRIDATGGADFRYLFVDEMHARSFVTDLEMALAGGQIIAKSVAMVAAPFTVPGLGAAATLRVRDLPSMADVAAFEPGDTIVLRRFSRVAGALNIAECIGTVNGYLDQPDGTQTWTFTRGSGAAGGNMSGGTVAVDSLALDYGVSGNGYYEVNAIDGAYGVNSPYAQIVTWTTAPTGANKVIRTRFGKLTGITGTANEYGLLAGTYAAANGSYFRASNTTFELHNITAQWWAGFTPVVVISPGGGSPYLSIGNPAFPAIGQGPGIVLSYNATAGLAQFWCYSPTGANYLVFDGNLLYWKAANTTLDTAGNLTATSATLSGAITATSGLVTGDLVVGTGGQIRSGAASFTAGVGWWLDYNAGVPRFRIGNPNADRVSWDGTTLTVRSGKLLIDGTASGHIGMGAAPYSIATLNVAADTDDASSYGLLVTNHSGTVSTLLTYGDGRLFLGGQLYILPGAWDVTGAGSNPPSVWNGPFGYKELSGWMRVYMYTGGGGGIPPTGPYSRGWIPVWLG